MTDVDTTDSSHVVVTFTDDVTAADFPAGWLTIWDADNGFTLTAVSTAQGTANTLVVTMDNPEAVDNGMPYRVSAGQADVPVPQWGLVTGI